MSDFSIDAVDHVEIHVGKQHEAAKWYEKIFGFKIIRELEFWSKAKSGPLFVGNKDNTVKLALFEGTKDGDGSIKRIAFRASGKNFVDFVNRLEQLKLLGIADSSYKLQYLISLSDEYDCGFFSQQSQ